MAYRNDVNFVREQVPELDVIDQLLEEIAELQIACCKRKRSLKGTNPTPWTADEAQQSIKEESQDVLNVLCAMGMFGFDDPEQNSTERMKRKMARWVNRVKLKKGK